MSVVFPRPLRPGDRIGVTSPSSGVEEPLLPRLRAGIEAARGRVQRGAGPVAPPPVVAGPVPIARDRHEITVGGQVQPLTKTEYQILATLAARQGEAVSREEVMLECWGTAVVGRSRSLDFFVGQIRAKLTGIPLHTVRSFGYRLDR